MENNITESHSKELDGLHVGETQCRMDTYEVTDRDLVAHPAPSRQPRKPRLPAGQRREDLVHPDLSAQNASSSVQGGLACSYSSGQPRKLGSVTEQDIVHSNLDASKASLSTGDLENLNSVQSDLARSSSSGQPRKLKSVTEDFVRSSSGLNVSLAAGNPKSLHSIVQLGDEIPDGDRNGPMSSTSGSVQNGLACSSSSGQPRKVKSVAGRNSIDLGLDTSDLPLSAAPGVVTSALARLNSARRLRRLGSVAKKREEDLSKVTEDREKVVAACVPNIVIVGESGVGKSSVINLIADQKLARTCDSALGCTFQHERYYIMLGKVSCTLWDTSGLDEGSEWAVPAKQAENNLRELTQQLARSGGIHLIIYCIRGARLTRALKRNYDIFYVAGYQKKVHVALIVTGLEHQQGEMETWWSQNEAELQRHGMRFDAHACVTTLDADSEDYIIQQRRSASRTLLRELILKYSTLPAWKTNASFLQRALPVFHNILRGAPVIDLGNDKAVRKVTICGSFKFTESLPGTTMPWEKITRQIGNEHYEFIKVDKYALDTVTMLEDAGGMGAGLLVFYTLALVDNRIPSADVDALKKFYDVAGGQIRPVIVVLLGCDKEEIAWACKVDVSLHYHDIHAHFIPFPCTDVARERFDEMVEHLYIAQAEVDSKPTNLFRRLSRRK